MLLQDLRERVAANGRKLVEWGLTTGSFGNLSAFDPASGLMAISPSGMDYGEVEPEDVVVVDLDGNQVEGARKPSSELALHLIFYRNRPDVTGVVHTHSTYATTMACLRKPLRPIHYLAAYGGGKVKCIPYYPFGSEKLAQAAYQGMGKDKNAVLLGGHGLVTVGEDLEFAMEAARQLEFLAQLCYAAHVTGGGMTLRKKALAHAIAEVKRYGKGTITESESERT